MNQLTLALFALLLALSTAQAAPARELFLAGGALAICSDLAPAACTTPPSDVTRTPPRYRFDADGLRRAGASLLWRDARWPARERRAWLASLVDNEGRALLRDQAQTRFAEACARPAGNRHAPCNQPSPWQRLDDDQRERLLSALEAAPPTSTRRAKERVHLAQSRERGGVAVLEAFVAASRAHAPGQRPRIAVVTASAIDPMEPVDFYLDLFRQLGAEAVWWPVDAALAAAKFEQQDCSQLDTQRMQHLGLSQRARIYPDLDAYQRGYCASEPALLLQVQGVFFAGGDQWRLRQTFFLDEQANPWGQALREAHRNGRIVVGGTSAGSAVQSGGWMLSNGSTEAALRAPSRVAPPPVPGCARGGCPLGVAEDTLTLWPAGGLGLAEGLIVDTHFSERGRELRLLMALQASQGGWGVGVDETSALQVTDTDGAREIRAHGKHGGWVLQRDLTGQHSALAWYVAPGSLLRITATDTAWAEGEMASPGYVGDIPHDALDSGALRSAAQQLARRCDAPLRLRAGTGTAQLSCVSGTQSRTGRGLFSVGPLHLSYLPPEQQP